MAYMYVCMHRCPIHVICVLFVSTPITLCTEIVFPQHASLARTATSTQLFIATLDNNDRSSSRDPNTPFTLALLIRSETGFAPMRAFTLHQLIRINDLIRIKLNHLLEVVSHRFSLLRVLIASVDATGTKIKAEQI